MKTRIFATYDDSGMITHWSVPVVAPQSAAASVDWFEVAIWAIAAVMAGATGIAFAAL